MNRMPSPEDLVQAQLEAYNRQDIDAFLAVYHPACEFVRWGGQVELRGHAEWRPRYLALWAGSPRLQARILNRIVLGRHVIDLEQLDNAADGPRRPVVVMYEVERDLIRRVFVLTEAA